MGVQGISGTDPLADGQGRQHLLGDRDLIGFLVHAHLKEDFLAVMDTKGQQVWSFLPCAMDRGRDICVGRESVNMLRSII